MFDGDRISVKKDDKNSGGGGGDGCTTMGMYLMPLKWPLKMVKMVNGTLGIFCHKTTFSRKSPTWILLKARERGWQINSYLDQPPPRSLQLASTFSASTLQPGLSAGGPGGGGGTGGRATQVGSSPTGNPNKQACRLRWAKPPAPPPHAGREAGGLYPERALAGGKVEATRKTTESTTRCRDHSGSGQSPVSTTGLQPCLAGVLVQAPLEQSSGQEGRCWHRRDHSEPRETETASP